MAKKKTDNKALEAMFQPKKSIPVQKQNSKGAIAGRASVPKRPQGR